MGAWAHANQVNHITIASWPRGGNGPANIGFASMADTPPDSSSRLLAVPQHDDHTFQGCNGIATAVRLGCVQLCVQHPALYGLIQAILQYRLFEGGGSIDQSAASLHAIQTQEEGRLYSEAQLSLTPLITEGVCC
eukprot:GHVR01004832.1.p2 GENE.GHVR01004832.1~~GHVR01004832.1.p2  ORF type:complete len:135 (+),score=20.66 GHVR01004832.1:595-999(+)